MKRLVLFVLAVATVIAVAAAILASGGSSASAQTPGPTAGSKLVGDLINPRGMKMGPDGMIYVAEAGTAGDMNVGSGDSASKSGFTGRISKVDPATGARTTVADKLPSNGGPEGDSVGPADVAFLNGQLYYVQTHGGDAYGFPNNPTGVYKVNANGTVTLVGNIGAFNIANPVDDITVRHQPDIEVGGNPYSMVVRDGAFYVSDGNQNQIEKVTPDGTVTRLNDFPGHPVTTGITYTGNGPFYVTTLGQFPFNPADGTIREVGYPTGSMTTVASGVSSLTGVNFGPGGQLYAVNFGDQATDPNGPPWIPFSASLMKVDLSTNTFTRVATGFTAITSLLIVGDTAYLTNNGVQFTEPGSIWQIPNVSSLAPIAVTPTAVATTPSTAATPTPVTGVVAPNTGSGPAQNNSFGWYLAGIVIGLAGAVLVAGGRFAVRGSRRS